MGMESLGVLFFIFCNGLAACDSGSGSLGEL
jgi:hypothetical protein